MLHSWHHISDPEVGKKNTTKNKQNSNAVALFVAANKNKKTNAKSKTKKATKKQIQNNVYSKQTICQNKNKQTNKLKTNKHKMQKI